MIEGRINNQPNETYRIELFSNAGFDPSSFGQGQTYLGVIYVTTDATGNGSFTTTLPTVNPSEGFVTATATAPDGATSQFSARLAIGEVLGSVYVVNTTDDTDDGVADPSHMTLRDAIIAANEHPGLNTIEFDIGSGVQTIDSELRPARDHQPGHHRRDHAARLFRHAFDRAQGDLQPVRREQCRGQVVYGLRLLAGGLDGPRPGVPQLHTGDRRFRFWQRWRSDSRLFHRHQLHRHGRGQLRRRHCAGQYRTTQSEEPHPMRGT